MQWEETYGLFSLLLGVFVAYMVGYNAKARAEKWGRWWLEPGWLTRPKGILKRAKLLTRRPNLLFFIHLMPAFIGFAFFIVAAFLREQTGPLIAFGVGYFVPRLLRYDYSGKKTQTFRLWMLVVTAKKIAAFCDLETAKAFIFDLGRNPDPEVRIAAVNGLMELDPRVGLGALEKLKADPDVEVRNAAMEAHRVLSMVASGKYVLKLGPMAKLMEEHKAWKQAVALGGFRKGQNRRNMHLTAEKIDDIIYSQLAQRLAFPSVYCRNCNARATQLEYADWTWVRCRICLEANDLELDVKTVVGQIGGETQRDLTEGTLLMSLWNEDRKTAVSADVDALEIIGNQPMNYDWAVSAVVQALQHRHDAAMPPISLKLTGAPSLEHNTKLLLSSVAQEG